LFQNRLINTVDKHIWYENHIVNFDDDLPKYKDAPKEQFGSGELVT